MQPRSFDVSFTFAVSPTDTEEEVTEQFNRLRVLVDAARTIGATIQITGSKMHDERMSQRECFAALRQQNATTITNNTEWATALTITYSSVTKVFTGNMPVNAKILSAIKNALTAGRIQCNEETMARIQSLVEQ